MHSLRNILRINGISTTLVGVLLLFLPDTFANWFEISGTGYFIATGVFFALFGSYVFFISIRIEIPKGPLAFITWVDWIWVGFSLILIVVLFNKVTVIGLAIMAAIAAWVGLMAYLEGRIAGKMPYKNISRK